VKIAEKKPTTSRNDCNILEWQSKIATSLKNAKPTLAVSRNENAVTKNTN
jgi:hypothetical protein